MFGAEQEEMLGVVVVVRAGGRGRGGGGLVNLSCIYLTAENLGIIARPGPRINIREKFSAVRGASFSACG